MRSIEAAKSILDRKEKIEHANNGRVNRVSVIIIIIIIIRTFSMDDLTTRVACFVLYVRVVARACGVYLDKSRGPVSPRVPSNASINARGHGRARQRATRNAVIRFPRLVAFGTL